MPNLNQYILINQFCESHDVILQHMGQDRIGTSIHRLRMQNATGAFVTRYITDDDWQMPGAVLI